MQKTKFCDTILPRVKKGLQTLVKIEGENNLVDTDELEEIKSGEDGRIFIYKNFALKILHSSYMTSDKSDDLRNAVPVSSRIVVPRAKVLDEDSKFRGYLTQFIEEDDCIMDMTVEEYSEEMSALADEVHKYFSENEIAITDTNPRNVLSSIKGGKRKFFLIDHDRDITKSSLLCDKERIIDGDYYRYNKKRLSLLKYKVLLLQVLMLAQKSNCKRDVLSYINTSCKNASLNPSISEEVLDKYDTISDYAKNTFSKIKRK